MSTSDKRYRLLIGGEWVDGAEGTTPIVNPATEEVVGHAPEASVAQAQAAARAAQEAFPKWWRTPPAERARLLHAVADKLIERQSSLVPLIISETGATAMVGSPTPPQKPPEGSSSVSTLGMCRICTTG